MTDRPSLRLFVLRVVVVALVATLFGRLWFLQVYAGDRYAEAAAANRLRTVVTTAPRGEVLDARGRELVRNRTALVVSVSRSTLLRQPDDGAAVLDRLSTVVGKPAAVLAQEITPCGGGVEPPCWRGSPYQPVPVAEYDAGDRAALTTVLRIEERREDFPGVTVGPSAVRDYPRGDLAAHLLGYLGPLSPQEARATPGLSAASLVGRAGVEATYDRQLRGRDGEERLVVDRLGAVTGTSGRTPARPGDKLVLSIDADVQEVAERALRSAVTRARGLRARGTGDPLVADSGSVVVMEAKTGRVVAMASYPSYDPAVFVGGASPAEYAQLVDETRGAPLVFRAIQGAYAPASTFKVVSTVAAVASGDYPLRGRYPCPGVYAPTGQRNFDSAPLGTVDLRQALVKSCDTVFYGFAYEQWLRDGGNDPVEQPRDPMVRMAQAFGLGERTGVDLPERAARHGGRPGVQAGDVGADPREPLRGRDQPGADGRAAPREPRVLRGRQPLPGRRRHELRDRPGRHARHAAAARHRLRRDRQRRQRPRAARRPGAAVAPTGTVREIAPAGAPTVPADRTCSATSARRWPGSRSPAARRPARSSARRSRSRARPAPARSPASRTPRGSRRSRRLPLPSWSSSGWSPRAAPAARSRRRWCARCTTASTARAARGASAGGASLPAASTAGEPRR